MSGVPLYILSAITAVLLVITASATAEARRVPKIYNAVITSSDNLEPSRAYPIVQPVLRPAAALTYTVQVPYVHTLQSSSSYFQNESPTSIGSHNQDNQQRYQQHRILTVAADMQDTSHQLNYAPDVLNNNHRNRNPGIPDVKPPPLPTSFKQQSTTQ